MEQTLTKTPPGSVLKTAFNRHLTMIWNNPVLAFLLLAACIFTTYNYYQDHKLVHGLGYIGAMWLCMFITDVWMLLFPSSPITPVMKKPKQEIFVFVLFTSLGILALCLRFVIIKDWNGMPGMYKLAILPLFLFIWPVVLAIYFLVKKYSLKDLGLRFDRSMLLALPIAAVTGITTWLVAPENIHWKEMLKEEGILQFLFDGFINAALSEEFMRYIGQTRLGYLFKNNGWGIFVTVCIWGLMHAPKWVSDGHGDLLGALSGSVRLIPLGLMWSYMIYRTKSIIPSILVHATNLWGLQNP